MDQSDQLDLEEIIEEWFREKQCIFYGTSEYSYKKHAQLLVKRISDKQYGAKVQQEREATRECQLCEDGVKHEHKNG